MPHAVIEYSDNLAADYKSLDVTQSVHSLLVKCGLFKSNEIKTRGYAVQDFIVGDKGRKGSFIHITVYLLEGRSVQQKQSLSQAILDSIATAMKNANTVTVDVRELVKDTYRIGMN